MASAEDTPRIASHSSSAGAGRRPALRAAHLVGGYGERAVLHGVSLEVEAGEMLAIVGPNGAGKSTLLRLLGGSLDPWQGASNCSVRRLRYLDRRALARRLAFCRAGEFGRLSFTVLEVVLRGRAPHLGSFHFESRGDGAGAREAFRALRPACACHAPDPGTLGRRAQACSSRVRSRRSCGGAARRAHRSSGSATRRRDLRALRRVAGRARSRRGRDAATISTRRRSMPIACCCSRTESRWAGARPRKS